MRGLDGLEAGIQAEGIMTVTVVSSSSTVESSDEGMLFWVKVVGRGRSVKK